MRTLTLLLAAIAFTTVPASTAQTFSASNLQVLYGGGFDDWYYGNNTSSGAMTTVTFEHFTAFAYGDVFLFIDYTEGDFVDVGGERLGHRQNLYSELGLRLSPVRMAGRELSGLVRDLYVAGQINRGSSGDFGANLIGVGADFTIPGFAVAGLNVYYRNDTFNEGTYQVTFVWTIPFSVGGIQASLGGFLDVYGTDADGADLHAQPQLLVRLAGLPVSIGTELYVHRNDAVTVVAPQAILKWSF